MPGLSWRAFCRDRFACGVDGDRTGDASPRTAMKRLTRRSKLHLLCAFLTPSSVSRAAKICLDYLLACESFCVLGGEWFWVRASMI